MKAMIMDMCILSHRTQCFLIFGHVVGVGAGKLSGLPATIHATTTQDQRNHQWDAIETPPTKLGNLWTLETSGKMIRHTLW
jgi:hypothetical protein